MESIVLLASFLIGGIPYCWLAVYCGQRVDLRGEGSGNVGASNAARTLGWKWYLPLIAADASKGFLSVEMARYLTGSEAMASLAGLIAVLGHCYPIYLSFKRGKGMSTTLGVLIGLGLYREVGLAAAACILALAISRIPSVGSLAGLLVLTVFAFCQTPTTGLCLLALVALVLLRHKENIVLLSQGKERKLEKEHLEDPSTIKS